MDERLREITDSTYGVILYQEQSMRIAKEIAGFSGPEADDLRKAIGKKLRDKMAALRDRFHEGARATGTTDAVVNELWAVNEAAADYSFNKCASATTRVILPDGKRIRLSEAHRLQPPEIMSMWADGTIRPHKVHRIVRTGKKPVYRVRCESGRQIRATADHRLLDDRGLHGNRPYGAGGHRTDHHADDQRQAARGAAPDHEAARAQRQARGVGSSSVDSHEGLPSVQAL